MSTSTPLVYKFGGAALADGAAVRHAATLVAAQRGRPLIVTVSAMGGVTNALVDIAMRAATGDLDASLSELRAVQERYVNAWQVCCDSVATPAVFESLLAGAERTMRAAARNAALTPRALDAILALGEQLAAHLVVGGLCTQGIAATYIDATEIIVTDGRAGGAVPDLPQTRLKARPTLDAALSTNSVPVVPGFIGRADDGATVTLGRGGSDLTATTLGAVTDAREIVLWKDVPGFLTADPRVVPNARVIPVLHMREAAELAYYGATVLHPRALIPLRDRDCIVRIRPFADPAAAGTSIVTELREISLAQRPPVCALSTMTGQTLVTVNGNGMLGVPGVAARVFTTLHKCGISVSLISQASSEHSICLAVPVECAQAAHDQLMAAFAPELARGEIDGIEVQTPTATIAVVGLGMAGQPGIAARLFAGLGKNAINVVAIAQGSSELNISVVVEEAQAARAQQVIHDEFQLGKIGGGQPAARASASRADVILLGFGLVGRALADMIVTDSVARSLRLVGIIDRSGYFFDPQGFSVDRMRVLLQAKQIGQGIAKARGGHPAEPLAGLQAILAHALTRPILVDVTAAETTPLLEYALTAGADLVLANKRPVSGARQRVEALRTIMQVHGRRMLHEATVGAGLPLLDTVAKLVEAGDSVRMIEGCPSGTMGYLFGEMSRGVRFSAALRGAMQLGYTEPDPRDDLSGIDVARKGLILGRLLGFEGELEDVRVESLVSPEAASLSLADFLSRLEMFDPDWGQRVDEARSRGAVLRYRVTATSQAVTVGLVDVAVGSALGVLDGTDNQFALKTDRYHVSPLVITGPGAGPAVTASGVLNDILKLASTHAR